MLRLRRNGCESWRHKRNSGGQIQIMIWFKSRLNHVQWFDLKNNDLIYKTDVIWFDLIWNFMIWFVIIPNHEKNFRWYAQTTSVVIQLLCWQATMKQVAKFTGLVWQIEYLWSSRGLGPNQWQLLFRWPVSTAAAATVRFLDTCRLKRIRD